MVGRHHPSIPVLAVLAALTIALAGCIAPPGWDPPPDWNHDAEHDVAWRALSHEELAG